MKSLLTIPCTIIIAVFASGCFGGGAHVSSSGSTFTTAAYEDGKRKGIMDRQAGLPREHSRHTASYAAAGSSEFQQGYVDGYSSVEVVAATATNREPLISVNGRGTVTVMKGPLKLSVCRTAGPNVEETRFVEGQQQLVVKSRKSGGPAVVQLFNVADGTEIERIAATEITGNQPSWAAGLSD